MGLAGKFGRPILLHPSMKSLTPPPPLGVVIVRVLSRVTSSRGSQGCTIQKHKDPNTFPRILDKEPHVHGGSQMMEELQERQRLGHERKIKRVNVLQKLTVVKHLQDWRKQPVRGVKKCAVKYTHTHTHTHNHTHTHTHNVTSFPSHFDDPLQLVVDPAFRPQMDASVDLVYSPTAVCEQTGPSGATEAWRVQGDNAELVRIVNNC